MYTQLKQLMRDHGYNPTEGGDWNGHDTQEFTTFAHFILAVPRKIAHRFLAYPQAFPDALDRLGALAGLTIGELPTSQSAGTPEPEPIPTPDAPVVENVVDSQVFDVSGKAAEEAPPVETETPPVAPAADIAPATEAPVDTAPPAAVEGIEGDTQKQE